MFHKFGSSTDGNTKGAQHSLAWANIGLSVFLILNINGESFTFQEDFQIAIMLKNRMAGNLVKHSFQSSSPRFYKVGIEPANCLLLGRGRNNHSRVAAVQGVVEPEEITVSTANGELGLAIGLRCCLAIQSLSASFLFPICRFHAQVVPLPSSKLDKQCDYLSGLPLCADLQRRSGKSASRPVPRSC